MPKLASAAVLDDLRTPASWTASASDQVKAQLRRDRDGSLCLDYDFAGVSGYAVMRRPLDQDWPDNFELTARLKGHGGVNDLQVKLVDASGDNVWWVNRRSQTLPAALTEFKLRRRHFDFAWGPATERALRRTAFIEFVISAGRDRGKGSLCLAGLQLQARAAPPATWPEPVRAEIASSLTLDFQHPREFNGLALRWPANRSGYFRLQASDHGRQWRTLRQVPAGTPGVYLPEQEARWLRLQGPGPKPEIALRSATDWPDLNAMLTELAAQVPRGDVPRTGLKQQNYWTLVGVDGGGARSGLLSEDGALELGRAGPSIEPSIRLADGRRISWAEVETTHSLREGHLPQPAVHWRHPEFALDIEAAADGPATAPQLLARYRLRNTSTRVQTYTLTLALRPWQVNPPQQFLSTQGGAVEVSQIAWRDGLLCADRRPCLRPTQRPQRVTALPLDAGLALQALRSAEPLNKLTDPQAHASAAMDFVLALAPGASATVGWVAPLQPGSAPPAALTPSQLDQRFDAAAWTWRERLNRVTLTLPPEAQGLADSLRAALAHILMSRDGPALQPGTRSYARAWIRDGAMMVAGLLRLGEVQAAREFVDWYGPQVFASGKVPCCIDARGADPVTENDSHGQYLYAVAELWRHTQDRALLQRHWPTVQRVMAWMDAQRQTTRTPQQPAHLFGLMPPSISHEGYSDKPAYSLWDDFWTLRGFKDGVVIAQALGQADIAQRWITQRDQFSHDLAAAIRASAALHGIAFVPGAADRGDFDASSTTVALNPAEARSLIAPAQLAATFERYWQEMSQRSAGTRPWRDYTPYELRNVGALVRLGHPDRAHAMLDFFLRDQRPRGWHGWAEVVLPDAREVRFLGDMPHAWISSDYIRSVLDLFAYEDGAALQLGAGWKPEWLAAPELALRGMSTPFGPLSYRLSRTPTGWRFALDQAGAPARLHWPGSGPLPIARSGTQTLTWQGRELPLPAAPSTVELTSP